MEMLNFNQAPQVPTPPPNEYADTKPDSGVSRPLHGIINDIGDVRVQLLNSKSSFEEALREADVERLKDREETLIDLKREMQYLASKPRDKEELLDEINERLAKIKEVVTPKLH